MKQIFTASDNEDKILDYPTSYPARLQEPCGAAEVTHRVTYRILLWVVSGQYSQLNTLFNHRGPLWLAVSEFLHRNSSRHRGGDLQHRRPRQDNIRR